MDGRSGMANPRFLADDMLARLARWLRAAGLDTALSENGEKNSEVLSRARREGRVILTRDIQFPGTFAERILIESRDLLPQLVEVLSCYPSFDPLASPFTRCMECNVPVEKSSPPIEIPDGVNGPFTKCPQCGRVFWIGSHVDRVREGLEEVRAGLRRVTAERAAGVPPPIDRREYDEFLRRALPLLGLSWRGYRRVRKGLRSRVRKRMAEAGVSNLDDYFALLRRDRRERDRFGTTLAVTITRFFRNRHTWLHFHESFFPMLEELAKEHAEGSPIRVWSLGCASGEEPFTLRMVWQDSGRKSEALNVLGSDLSEPCLERAAAGLYFESSVHSMPPEFRGRFLAAEGGQFRLDPAVQRSVRFEWFDWRIDSWPGPFHWILARNNLFTYLDQAGRREAVGKLENSLVAGGFLWIGGNETLPDRLPRWEKLAPNLYRYSGGSALSLRTDRSSSKSG